MGRRETSFDYVVPLERSVHGRTDCKHRYSACASGRSQDLALLSDMVLACVTFPIIVRSGLCSDCFMVMLGIQASPSEPNDPTPLGVRYRKSYTALM